MSKELNLLMIQVGHPVDISNVNEKENNELYLKRLYLFDGTERFFSKAEIINADSQMQTLINSGINVTYGYTLNSKNPGYLLKSGLTIRNLIKKHNINLVHVLWGNILALNTLFFSSKPVIISFCGSDLLGSYDSNLNKTRNGKFSTILSRRAASMSAWNITKSEGMKKFLPVKAQKKTSVLPNGVNLSKFYIIDKTEARKKLDWSPEKKYILFFYQEGNNVKNLPLAEKTFNLIKKQIPGSELIIVNKVAHEKLVLYYNAADLMLLTSLHEGSNNSLKEAIACDLPVVSVPCGDTPERLQNLENCYVSSEWNENELADNAIKILNKNQRSNGQDEIKQLSEKNINDRLINIYKEVLKKYNG